MDERPSVGFNRLTGVKCYFLRVFAISDLFLIAIAMMIFISLLDSFKSFAGFMLIYCAYLLKVRLNKPMGYDAHFFKNITSPRSYRPGRTEYAIEMDYKDPNEE